MIKNEIVECCTDGRREAAIHPVSKASVESIKNSREVTEIYARKINKSDVSLPALGRLFASSLSFLSSS